MYIGDLNWKQAKKQTNKIVILPTGALEAHGLSSGLDTDISIPVYIAKQLEKKRKNIIRFPAINYGFCYTLRQWPGTVSLRSQTLYNVFLDILTEIKRNGFKKILILNGHGGNEGVAKAVLKENSEKLGLKANVCSWWTLPSVKKVVEKLDTKFIGHADFTEASCYLYIKGKIPEKNNDKSLPKFPVGNVFPIQKSIFSKTGHMGKIIGIKKEIGEKIIKASIKDYLKIIDNDLIWYD